MNEDTVIEIDIMSYQRQQGALWPHTATTHGQNGQREMGKTQERKNRMLYRDILR